MPHIRTESDRHTPCSGRLPARRGPRGSPEDPRAADTLRRLPRGRIVLFPGVFNTRFQSLSR